MPKEIVEMPEEKMQKEEYQIPEQFILLTEVAQKQEAIINLLSGRLSPVCEPEKPGTSGEAPPPPDLCPVAHETRESRWVFASNTRRLMDILDRLQL